MASAHVATPPEAVTHEEPQALDTPVLGLWIWLSAESIFFASLIGTFLLLKGKTNNGASLAHLIDLPLTFIGTIILLTSSLTMALGFAQLRAGRVERFRVWLIITAILGLGFLGFQAVEFTGFYHHGLTLQSSPEGSAFFTLTGFHGLHVAFGVFWLLSLLAFSFKKEFTKEGVVKAQVLGLYWHFVDVVWVVIFSLVYLLGKVG